MSIADKMLACECGRKAIPMKQLADLPTFSVAQYPRTDATNPEHLIFDRIHRIQNINHEIWWDFSEGALPVCGSCIKQMTADGLFRAHDFGTCDYQDCRDIRSSIEKKTSD
jgi:hypothetical protein